MNRGVISRAAMFAVAVGAVLVLTPEEWKDYTPGDIPLEAACAPASGRGGTR